MTQTLVSRIIDIPTSLLKNSRMRSGRKRITPRMGPTLFLATLSLSLNACAVLFPDRTAPKSASYTVSFPKSPWQRLPVGEGASTLDSMKADIAYENTQTGAVISLNSLCRKYNHDSLDSLTINLVRDIDNRKILAQKKITVNKADALDSLFEGIVDSVRVNINTIVLTKDDCTYDFIYVEVPKDGKINTNDFQDFVASFQVDK